MNPMIDQVFNQQNINPTRLQQVQMNQYHLEQYQEITKAVKAIHDYCAAARNIAPEYQQAAAWVCLAVIAEEINKG